GHVAASDPGSPGCGATPTQLPQKHHPPPHGRSRRRAGGRQLVLNPPKGVWADVPHGKQEMAGEDEGHRRGSRHVGVGLTHQRRRHVAGAVLDIEAAGDFDLLPVLPGRHPRSRQSLPCSSSRAGPAIPASRSTALSSSGVGLRRSIQTALSGSAARSTATAFFSEKSEGTKTENIQNSGTDYLEDNRLSSILASA